MPNCVNHNLRFYPVVQHIRRMIEGGELGEVLVVQGNYSQDWLLYDTDYNWRIEKAANGALRVVGDIGSHWMDLVQHLTGLKITALCADLQIVHKTRKRPKQAIETFAGKTLSPEDYDEVPIETEDFGAVLVHLGRSRAWSLYRQPGECRLQEPVPDGDLRNQMRRHVEPGAAGRALDRPPQLAEPDHP